MRFPPKLANHDAVALLAPASPFSHNDALDSSVQALRSLGLVPVLYPSCTAKSSYLAGDDALRANDLLTAFADPEIRGIFCMRGGYGTMRILERLDIPTLRANPKVFVGLSDITALHLFLQSKCDLAGLHAPMPFRYPELPLPALTRLKNLLFGSADATYTASDGLCTLHPGNPIRNAPFIGGNLSLCTALCASRFFPDPDGAILFLEDIGETVYRLDRLLTSLLLAGVFQRVSGVVFGGFTDCGDPEEIRAMIARTVPENLPCITGFPAGHLQNNHGFFIGQRVTLDADCATLHFHEIQRTES